MIFASRVKGSLFEVQVDPALRDKVNLALREQFYQPHPKGRD